MLNRTFVRFVICAATLAGALATPQSARAQYGTAFLSRRLGELQAQFAVGMSLFGPVQTGTLRRNARRALDFVLPAGACYKFIAVGDGDVTDLDLYVRRNRQVVARDTANDNFPVVSHCATDEARVQVEIHMYAGQGEYAFGVYQGPNGPLEITPVLNPGQPAPPVVAQPNARVPLVAPPRPVPPRPMDPLSARLFELSQTFAPGSVLVGDVHRGALSHGSEQDFFVNLRPSECYVFIAVGAPSATDVDTYLFDPNRRRVTSDRERNNFPRMTHCSGLPGPYRVQVKMYRGEGPFVMGVFAQNAVAAPPQLAPAQRPPPAQPAPSDALVMRLRELGGSFAPGQAPASEVFRGALSTHGTRDFFLNLQPGRCYTAIVVGAPSATDIDLYIFDPNRRRATSDRDRNNFPHVTHCAGLPGPYRFEVKMYRGEGPFVMQVFAQ